jgi:F-type H+-transporting ATPase subunit b
MKKLFATLPAVLVASPALAASGPFLSLGNTDFVVILAFLLFVAVLVKAGVPGMLMGLLDKRADGIRSELDEARALREDARTVLASFERQQREVQAQADEIVKAAKADAELAAAQATKDLEDSVARRLAAAVEQIASAEAAAVKDVRDQAATVAIAAAKSVIAQQMTAAEANKLIDASIAEVDAKLH